MPDEPDDDHSLLRDYCASRAEPAFRALVERHLPAVWNAARRMVNGDAALAEDIAQEVFAHLATHAAKLPPRVVLGGWLHRHTCFTAAKTIRAAVRRRIREHEHAAAMNAVSDTDPWPNIAPHLDAALNSLPAADRAAVVLRFFEKRDFRGHRRRAEHQRRRRPHENRPCAGETPLASAQAQHAAHRGAAHCNAR